MPHLLCYNRSSGHVAGAAGVPQAPRDPGLQKLRRAERRSSSAPGITAVVGPNGSGKSNLADALRWVLGEQNPRVLRSRKSEEIVFAGGTQAAASRLRRGQHRARQHRRLAAHRLRRGRDHPPAASLRRERIPGQPRARAAARTCSDLLARGRVGQNSYAIMGQGLVDQVLNLHREERRALIEEAADVRGHRVKIQDAVERLAPPATTSTASTCWSARSRPAWRSSKRRPGEPPSTPGYRAARRDACRRCTPYSGRTRKPASPPPAALRRAMNALVQAQAEGERLETSWP